MKQPAAALLATFLFTIEASAQGMLDEICADALEEGETVATDAEYAANPMAHADDFCALARFEPYKAARQLSKAAGINRRFSNPNRFYFDPRRDRPLRAPNDHIQLRRAWMTDWTITQASGLTTGSGGSLGCGLTAMHAVFSNPASDVQSFRVGLCVDQVSNGMPTLAMPTATWSADTVNPDAPVDQVRYMVYAGPVAAVDHWKLRFDLRNGWLAETTAAGTFGTAAVSAQQAKETIETLLDCLDHPLMRQALVDGDSATFADCPAPSG